MPPKSTRRTRAQGFSPGGPHALPPPMTTRKRKTRANSAAASEAESSSKRSRVEQPNEEANDDEDNRPSSSGAVSAVDAENHLEPTMTDENPDSVVEDFTASLPVDDKQDSDVEQLVTEEIDSQDDVDAQLVMEETSSQNFVDAPQENEAMGEQVAEVAQVVNGTTVAVHNGSLEDQQIEHSLGLMKTHPSKRKRINLSDDEDDFYMRRNRSQSPRTAQEEQDDLVHRNEEVLKQLTTDDSFDTRFRNGIFNKRVKRNSDLPRYSSGSADMLNELNEESLIGENPANPYIQPPMTSLFSSARKNNATTIRIESTDKASFTSREPTKMALPNFGKNSEKKFCKIIPVPPSGGAQGSTVFILTDQRIIDAVSVVIEYSLRHPESIPDEKHLRSYLKHRAHNAKGRTGPFQGSTKSQRASPVRQRTNVGGQLPESQHTPSRPPPSLTFDSPKSSPLVRSQTPATPEAQVESQIEPEEGEVVGRPRTSSHTSHSTPVSNPIPPVTNQESEQATNRGGWAASLSAASIGKLFKSPLNLFTRNRNPSRDSSPLATRQNRLSPPQALQSAQTKPRWNPPGAFIEEEQPVHRHEATAYQPLPYDINARVKYGDGLDDSSLDSSWTARDEAEFQRDLQMNRAWMKRREEERDPQQSQQPAPLLPLPIPPHPAAATQSTGKQDSHLPYELRKLHWRDLPPEWQAVSMHMKPSDEQLRQEEEYLTQSELELDERLRNAQVNATTVNLGRGFEMPDWNHQNPVQIQTNGTKPNGSNTQPTNPSGTFAFPDETDSEDDMGDGSPEQIVRYGHSYKKVKFNENLDFSDRPTNVEPRVSIFNPDKIQWSANFKPPPYNPASRAKYPDQEEGYWREDGLGRRWVTPSVRPYYDENGNPPPSLSDIIIEAREKADAKEKKAREERAREREAEKREAEQREAEERREAEEELAREREAKEAENRSTEPVPNTFSELSQPEAIAASKPSERTNIFSSVAQGAAHPFNPEVSQPDYSMMSFSYCESSPRLALDKIKEADISKTAEEVPVSSPTKANDTWSSIEYSTIEPPLQLSSKLTKEDFLELGIDDPEFWDAVNAIPEEMIPATILDALDQISDDMIPATLLQEEEEDLPATSFNSSDLPSEHSESHVTSIKDSQIPTWNLSVSETDDASSSHLDPDSSGEDSGLDLEGSSDDEDSLEESIEGESDADEEEASSSTAFYPSWQEQEVSLT